MSVLLTLKMHTVLCSIISENDLSLWENFRVIGEMNDICSGQDFDYFVNFNFNMRLSFSPSSV